MWKESIYDSSLICLIIDTLYIWPYFVSMPSKGANAIISCDTGLICITCFFYILPDRVCFNSYDPPFSLRIISHGPVNTNSVLSKMCLALLDLTALLANIISPISNTRGSWWSSLIRLRWYAHVSEIRRDVIYSILNRSLACSAENILTHCFELVSLIGKEKHCPQTIMLFVMSVKCTGHELHAYMSNKIASMLTSGVPRSWLKILRPLLRHRFTLSIMI